MHKIVLNLSLKKFDLNLNEEERIVKREVNEAFELKLYGWKIIENREESKFSVEFLWSKIKEYEEAPTEAAKTALVEWEPDRVLNLDEIARLKGYIRKIQDEVEETHWLTVQESSEKDKSITHVFLDSIKKVNISRDDTIWIFNDILQFLGLSQRARVGINGEVQSIYDSPTELVIPDTKEFESLWAGRVLNLIIHEILCHYINQKNHEENNWKLRFNLNVPKEEGLAILWEKWHAGKWFEWKDLISAPFARILAGEILVPEEFRDFVDLFSQISERKGSVDVLINRHKRNQETEVKWVQHKDVAYIRWLIANLSYLKEWWDIENLFVWKVWLDAIKNWEYSFDNENMLFPFLITDVFLFFLLTQKEGLKFTHRDFIRYLESKYGSIIKKESFAKVTKLLWRKQLLELFTILKPLSNAIAQSWVDASIWENISRVHKVLDKSKA